MKVSVWHGADTSALIVDDAVIEYTRRIHRYEAEADYKTVVTELRTYGAAAAQSCLNYLRGAR